MADERSERLRGLIGRGKTRRCLVTAQDIRRFAQAIGETDPIYFDEAYARTTPAGGLVAPPLFCQTLTFEDLPAERLPADGSPAELDVPIDARRAVGGKSEYSIQRLVRAGEVVTVVSTLRDVSVKQGSTGELYLIVVETRFLDEAGGPIASELATYIKRV